MKSPTLAFTLNFFLPGTGLWYLGKWGWGIVNFLVVFGIGVLLVFVLPDELFEKCIRYVAIGCAGGSGGLAMAIAKQMNQKGNNEPEMT
jgi:hypothetical protein